MKSIRLILILFLFTGLVGCKKVVLLQGLDQRDAIEIMVMLAKNGIEVHKEAVGKQQDVTWTLKIADTDEQKARELLQAHNLPRQKELGLSGVCKDSSLIPTPKMEKCREMLALKGEIINSLESIPGVINADVVVNIPDKEDFPDPNAPVPHPTASVVIQVDGKDVSTASLDENKIQQFVANAVTGMDLRDVAVIISRTENNRPLDIPLVVDPDIPEKIVEVIPDEGDTEETDVEAVEDPEDLVSVGGIKMDAESAGRFKAIVGSVLVLFLVLSVLLIGVLLKMAQSRKSQALVPIGKNAADGDMDELVAQATDAPRGR